MEIMKSGWGGGEEIPTLWGLRMTSPVSVSVAFLWVRLPHCFYLLLLLFSLCLAFTFKFFFICLPYLSLPLHISFFLLYPSHSFSFPISLSSSRPPRDSNQVLRFFPSNARDSRNGIYFIYYRGTDDLQTPMLRRCSHKLPQSGRFLLHFCIRFFAFPPRYVNMYFFCIQ